MASRQIENQFTVIRVRSTREGKNSALYFT
jgi:hypothetical protein